MTVDLHRTFSLHKNVPTTDDGDSWIEYFGLGRGRKTWSDLHENLLVVVLGEAGIGKTVEFQNEASRLVKNGKHAFFISLNQLPDSASWQLAIAGYEAELCRWEAGDDIGYFFLDSVDEARLVSHGAYERALTVVQKELGPRLHRVRIAISSRVTDWATPAVQSAIEIRLAKSIGQALSSKAVTAPLGTPQAVTVKLAGISTPTVVEVLAVELDSLQMSEARRCAAAFGVQAEGNFWDAVLAGSYDFMASRPLDLQWMVALWNQRRTLGTYTELIEANIHNRLREVNENYVADGETLSLDELKTGAVGLAAAAEFGNCAFFTIDPGTLPSKGECNPYEVLSDWKPDSVRRLLATAVFDVASFGRIKFHHRSIREYLSAQWVCEQLTLGVPLQRLEGLFAGRPHGRLTLIAERRASLSWLAAVNVRAREWVVREFPEVLLVEGDPQAWDRQSAEKAFAKYLASCKPSLHVNRFSSPSACLKVGRALGTGTVSAAMVNAALPLATRTLCFRIAQHAKLADCAENAFAAYSNSRSSEWERQLALDVLGSVGSVSHREAVMADLRARKLGSNELIARALPVVCWKRLSVGDLASVFDSTQAETAFGAGPLGRVLTGVLLPVTVLDDSFLLLKAVMASVPKPSPGERYSKFSDSEPPVHAWLFDVLAKCYQRVLDLLPLGQTIYPDVLVETAELVEALRDSGFIDKEELAELHLAIALHSPLRWRVALAIAMSKDIRASVSRLTWGSHCLVNFDALDMPELVYRANVAGLHGGESEIWFTVGVSVAFQMPTGLLRAKALRGFELGIRGSTRAVLVGVEYRKRRSNKKVVRESEIEDAAAKLLRVSAHGNFVSRLHSSLAQIRGGTDVESLQYILQDAFNRGGHREYGEVDFDAMEMYLSPEIARAFLEGLKVSWSAGTPPNPSDYPNGDLPWSALLSLAGLRKVLLDSTAISALSQIEAAKAAQLAVWEHPESPPWFCSLLKSQRSVAEAALVPWVVAEAESLSPGNGVRGALALALRCPSGDRNGLIAPLLPLVRANRISRRESLVEVLAALREDGLLSSIELCKLLESKLSASIDADGRVGDFGWLYMWLKENPAAAWSWFDNLVGTLPAGANAEVSSFASAVGNLRWIQLPLDSVGATVLLGIHALLCSHPSPTPPVGDESHAFGSPSSRLRSAIENTLLSTRGILGHRSLVAIADRLTDPEDRAEVLGKVEEHATLDVAKSSNWTVSDLKAVGSPFLSQPRTEAQLYDQVVARLEEVRLNLEEGPFSERDLFNKGMPEKFLQRWLAAKFRETQNRRFSVHREEEVDDDKETDIQLSCPDGNVCVEIKPIDATRYSANKLASTLEDQIVGQYLKGNNSSRGILVLIQLDDKTWSIPGVGNRQPVSALVKYLNGQADLIKNRSPGVNELIVFCMRGIV
jgi:hypothetical protein